MVAHESVSIRQLAEMVAARYPTAIEYVDARVGDVHSAVVDSSLAWELFGWKAEVLFREGLEELFNEVESTPR
jgi:nucleoside-diphosphate-sugar epimerase